MSNRSIFGIIFIEGLVLLIKPSKGKTFQLPGGPIISSETPIGALRFHLLQQANIRSTPEQWFKIGDGIIEGNEYLYYWGNLGRKDIIGWAQSRNWSPQRMTLSAVMQRKDVPPILRLLISQVVNPDFEPSIRIIQRPSIDGPTGAIVLT